MKKQKIKNRWKCPEKLWKKFSERGQIAYNNMMSQSEQEFISPLTNIPDKEWNTIRHNFAYTAAFEFS